MEYFLPFGSPAIPNGCWSCKSCEDWSLLRALVSGWKQDDCESQEYLRGKIIK